MSAPTRHPAEIRVRCAACGHVFVAAGRARMARLYCDKVCQRWANSKTGKSVLAEHGETLDPPIPDDVYRRFPLLAQIGVTGEVALAAWGHDCDCLRCKVHRAAHPAPIQEAKKRPRRRANVRFDLGPRYPCGHPRTHANSYAVSNDSACCKTCSIDAAYGRRLAGRS